METAKIQEGAALYYRIFTVVYWLPVFVSAEPCLIFTESLNYCQQHKGLRINAVPLGTPSPCTLSTKTAVTPPTQKTAESG